MIQVITSNGIPVRSIRSYNDNFMLCHLRTERLVPLSQPTDRYLFEVYHQDEMEVGDEYQTESIMVFDFIPEPDITQSLDAMVDRIIKTYQHSESIDEDLRDELIVAVCCDHSWNAQVVNYLNSRLADEDCEVKVLDLYRYMGIASTEKMTQVVKNNLGSEFVYPDDPISYGYALYQVLKGTMV